MDLKRRVARWVPFLNRYAEMAPACCNACRSCSTTNVVNLLGLLGAALAAPFVRLFRPQPVNSRTTLKT
jgi:hypothetical protein